MTRSLRLVVLLIDGFWLDTGLPFDIDYASVEFVDFPFTEAGLIAQEFESAVLDWIPKIFGWLKLLLLLLLIWLALVVSQFLFSSCVLVQPAEEECMLCFEFFFTGLLSLTYDWWEDFEGVLLNFDRLEVFALGVEYYVEFWLECSADVEFVCDELIDPEICLLWLS